VAPVSAAQQTTVTITGPDLIVVSFAVLAMLGYARRKGRALRRAARDAAELRHRRRVELAMARPGHAAEFAVPAAVQPLPPSAYPLTAAPGSCRHEKIVPVITSDGEHVRWLCANPRCLARFDKSVAIYEAGT
jgi:hypothetical protein